jgi:hypothetical protein
MRQCAAVDEDVNFNRCARNAEGRVVLPSGQFIPRMIPGNTIRDRIEEWHKRNGSPPRGSVPPTSGLMLSVERMSTPVLPSLDVVSNQYLGARYEANPPQIFKRGEESNHASSFISTSTYPLSKSDRVASLAQELASLQDDEELGDEVAQLVAALNTRSARRSGDKANPNDRFASDQPARRMVPVVEIPVSRPNPGPASRVTDSNAGQAMPTPVQQASTSDVPEHPYARAKDAIHRPLPETTDKAPSPREPLYRTQPPIYDKEQVERAYQKLLDTPVTVTIRDTLALSPETRARLREDITNKRIINFRPNERNTFLADTTDSDPLPFASDPSQEHVSVLRLGPDAEGPYPSADDAVERYTREHPEDRDLIRVGKESGALRAVWPVVANREEVECIIDPGSQIVAMSETVSRRLGLSYDPSVTLNMQSANGEVDRSLGLARNVPFRLDSLSFYLQVHIIRNPAYDVLLGRPFDVLLETTVINFPNEDQTLTLHEPGTGKPLTVPTMPRGKHTILVRKKDFQNSSRT